LGNKPIYTSIQAGRFVGLFCLLLLTSCSGDKKVIARVDGNALTRETAEMMMIHMGYDTENPKNWAQFVADWCEQQVLKEELRAIDPNKFKLVEMRSQAFMGELSKYYLEELALSNEVDSVVSETELKKYYEIHKHEFALHDYIVKALYLKVLKAAPILDKLKVHFLLKNDKDVSKVNSYAKLYAEDFYFDDAQWIYFNDLTKDIPIRLLNKDNLVLNRTKTYLEEGEFVYFINIMDYKLMDATPPFDFLKEQIREIIVSKRLNSLRKKKESTLIKNIKNKHEIKIHL
jgi:hypothetical protein